MNGNESLAPKQKSNNDKKNKYLFIASIVAAANVLFANNFILSLIVVLVELIILIYQYLNKNLTKYLSYYLIFLSLSFEFEAFIGSQNIYGFKNFRVFGVNLGILCLLPIIPYILFKKTTWLKIRTISKELYIFIITMLILNFSGIFFGLFNILVNDNNITNFPNVLFLFIGRVYELMLFPLLIISFFSFIIINEYERIDIISDVLVAILFSSVISMLTSLIAGKYGIYGGVLTLLTPLISSYIPFMALFFFNINKVKSEMMIKIAYFIGIILLIIYNASGKLIILIVMTPILIIFTSMKQKKHIASVLLFLSLPLIVYGIIFFATRVNGSNILLSTKIDQALSLLNIFSDNWLINLPESPKFRVVEFLNIFYEYLKKPWLVIFGKGYLGTIKDHLGLFNYSLGAFSDIQWSHGVFYILHASINTLFLTHGILGIGLFIYIARVTYKQLLRSHWGIIGAYWFMIYYGYSITISAFGLVSLLYAMYETNINKHEAIQHKQENKPMSKIVLWGYYGQGNFGDDLMLHNICKHLSSDECNEISIITADKGNTEILENHNIKVFQTFKDNKYKNLRLFIEILKDNDYLVWGGGTCFSDEDGMPNLLIILLAKILGLKVVFIGIGIGNINRVLNKIIVRISALFIDSLYLRDEKSFMIATEYFQKDCLFLTEDIAYIYKPFKKYTNNGDTLTISLRNLENYITKEEQEKFVSNIYLFLDSVLKTNIYMNINVLVLDTKLDISVNEKLYREMLLKYGSNYEINFINENSYKRKIEVLEESNLNVLVRLHGIFISEVNGIMTIGIGYSGKVKSFMQGIDSKGFVDIKDVIKDENNLIKLYEIIKQSDNRQINMDIFRKRALRNFDFIGK